jgi:hypothetical protein
VNISTAVSQTTEALTTTNAIPIDVTANIPTAVSQSIVTATATDAPNDSVPTISANIQDVNATVASIPEKVVPTLDAEDTPFSGTRLVGVVTSPTRIKISNAEDDDGEDIESLHEQIALKSTATQTVSFASFTEIHGVRLVRLMAGIAPAWKMETDLRNWTSYFKDIDPKELELRYRLVMEAWTQFKPMSEVVRQREERGSSNEVYSSHVHAQLQGFWGNGDAL